MVYKCNPHSKIHPVTQEEFMLVTYMHTHIHTHMCTHTTTPAHNMHMYNAYLYNLSHLQPTDTHAHQDKHMCGLQVQCSVSIGDCNHHCYFHMD